MSRSRRSASTAVSSRSVHLGAVDLGPARPLAGLLELALGVMALGPQPVEPRGRGPLRLALAPTALAEIGQVGLDSLRGGR